MFLKNLVYRKYEWVGDETREPDPKRVSYGESAKLMPDGSGRFSKETFFPEHELLVAEEPPGTFDVSVLYEDPIEFGNWEPFVLFDRPEVPEL